MIELPLILWERTVFCIVNEFLLRKQYYNLNTDLQVNDILKQKLFLTFSADSHIWLTQKARKFDKGLRNEVPHILKHDADVANLRL